MKCSHVLLKVDDLHQAVRDFRELGFVVDYAAAAKRPRHAHIWFSAGPIIELLTTPPGASLMKWPIEAAFGRGAGTRMTRWARSEEGICDAAVLTGDPDFAGLLDELHNAGFPTGRAVNWTRTKPDGTTARFSFAYPRSGRVPFLVTPYDPPQHPAEVAHPNGATGLSRVLMDVSPADRAAFDQLIGSDDGFDIQHADTTRVRAIELAGLGNDPDPALLHGAVVRPHTAPQNGAPTFGGTPCP
jgi:hypothetical protein